MLSKKETEKIKWSSLCFFFCSNWHHSNEGMQPEFCVVIHTITDSVLAVLLPWSPFATWKRLQFSPVIEFHSQIGSSEFLHLFQLVSDTYFVITLCLKMPQILLSYYATGKTKKQYFLSMLLKNTTKNTLDPDGCILLKLVYRVDRATSQQSTARKGL